MSGKKENAPHRRKETGAGRFTTKKGKRGENLVYRLYSPPLILSSIGGDHFEQSQSTRS